MNYAKHIVDHYHHASPVDQLWEFGHPLWRPLGFVLWSTLHGPLDGLFQGQEVYGALSALVAFNIIGGCIGVAMMFLLLAGISESAPAAAVLAIGFAATNAIVNYSQTGTAYVLGVACQVTGLYIIWRSIQYQRFGVKQALLAAIPLGLSIAIWFAYVLPMAGLLCFALLWPGINGRRELQRRGVFVLQIACGIASMLAVSYTVVMIGGHINSFARAKQWVVSARHDIQPTKGVIRTVGTIPRGFFWLGSGSTIWKEKLFGHGRTQITAADLLRAGIWKLALVYAILLLTCIQLWKSSRGRLLMICLAIAAIPVLLFAAFLFDPSPPERYLAVYPLLFCGFALALAERNNWACRIGLPVFVAAMLAVNCSAMLRSRTDAAMQSAAERLNAIVPKLEPNDRVFILTTNENLFAFMQERPFAPESRRFFQFVGTVEKNSASTRLWRQRAAGRILNVWRSGGRVWLCRQMLAPKPSLQWNWVEGDDDRIHWAEVPAFFQKLDLGEPFGGPEGFVEILPTENNKQILQTVLSPGETSLSSRKIYIP
ncbi:MAG: hypothetical protein JO319_19305 [Acidobacteriaceae bacterium]|nr:hypothetical protein [Acidobacteriaceae bacterium]